MTPAAYRVMMSDRGTSTVVSIHSFEYPEMVQSGLYEEVYAGTKKECDDHQSEISELIED